MSYTSEPEDLQLTDYAGVLRRRWRVILACAITGLLAGAGYLHAAHKVYTATASVYVTATSGTTNQVVSGRAGRGQDDARYGYHPAASRPGERGGPGELPGAGH